MKNELSELADELMVIMEGSDEELNSILDQYGDETLTMLWDHESPKLPDTPDTSSNKHEWIRTKESMEQSMEYRMI